MNTERVLHSILADFWIDLRQPSMLWQAGVLILCLALAWWLSRAALRALRRSRQDAAAGLGSDDTAGQPLAPGATDTPMRTAVLLLNAQAARQALARVLFPLYGLGLVSLSSAVLERWHPTPLLRLAIALLAATALARTVIHVVSRLTQSPTLAAFERAVVALAWTGAALYVTGLHVEVVGLFESVTLDMGRETVSLWMLLSGAFWVLMTLMGALWLGGVLEARLLSAQALDPSLRAVLSRLLRALLLTVGVLVGLSLVGLDITALSVFGGALGVGLGLGLQRIASNYISGFVVLLERMVRIGDVVKVDQFAGEVREIRTRFTVLRSLDGIEHIVPNEMLATLPVQNLSRAGALRLRVCVQVSYATDLDLASRLAVEAALSTPRVLATPPPAVLLSQFAADGLTLDLSFSIADPRLGQANAISDVARAVWAKFREAGVSVPFPQREIRVVSGDVAASAPPPSKAS